MSKITYQGVSGATVYFDTDEDYVSKSASPETETGQRVLDQGMYLRKIASSAVPRVHSIDMSNCKYTMDRLYEIPWHLIDYKDLFTEILWELANHVWPHTGVDLDPYYDQWKEVHHEYVMERARRYAPEHADSLNGLFNQVKRWSLRKATTHGDPTFENCMLRYDDDNKARLVLTDPLPPTRAIPPFVAVDLGKMLQSAYGYETMKSGLNLEGFGPMQALDLLSLDEPDRRAALYFCAVHYVRLLPYQRPENRDKYLKILGRVIQDAGNI